MPMNRSYLLAIGVMTGNSLDGVDAVLTRFDEDGTIQDLAAHSLASTAELAQNLRELRTAINGTHCDMPAAVAAFDARASATGTFEDVQGQYVTFVATAIKELIQIAKQDTRVSANYDLSDIDVIGFHGQTCAHFPPSIAKSSDPTVVYTCQVGDGQLLADLTGITVVYDFRSDDLMNGGEAAPLAPGHHQHLAALLRRRGQFPVAFCNAGNTGNFTVISVKEETGELCVLGWDVGPFNNYPDKLMQKELGQECDKDGQYGVRGQVNEHLLRKLFETAVVTNDGENFLLASPPKSSDPQWYRMIPELMGEVAVDGTILSFADRLRTAEYFAAYIYAHALTMIPQDVRVPSHYALCGGGWKNPVPREHFAGLLQGDQKNPVLREHQKPLQILQSRISGTDQSEKLPGKEVVVALSEDYGFDGTAMEARIFADAAVCRIKGEPFTKPSTTGARSDTVTGIIRFPAANEANATDALVKWMAKYKSRDLTVDRSDLCDGRWSRAVAGWHGRFWQQNSTVG